MKKRQGRSPKKAWNPDSKSSSAGSMAAEAGRRLSIKAQDLMGKTTSVEAVTSGDHPMKAPGRLKSTYGGSKEAKSAAAAAAQYRAREVHKPREWTISDIKEQNKPPMTDEDLKRAKEVFFAMDQDNNGEIDARELRQMLQSLGQNPSDEEVLQMLAMVDGPAGNGKLDLREFLQYFEVFRGNQFSEEDDVMDAYRSLGGDKQGNSVSKIHIQKMLIDDYDLHIDVDEIFLDDSNKHEVGISDFKKLLLT